MQMKIAILTAVSFLAAVVCLIAPAAAQSSPQTQEHATTQTRSKATTTSKMPSDQEISEARSQGKVWVNTSSKVYHKNDQYYGKTKHGKFMTEDEARERARKPSNFSQERSAPATLDAVTAADNQSVSK